MNEDNVLVYIVDSVESFDNEVERFIRKKKFKKLPNQITELVGELQRGEFSGIILLLETLSERGTSLVCI